MMDLQTELVALLKHKGGKVMNNIHGFERKLKDAINAARDLGYSKDTITKIENAKSEAEIEHILIDARRKEL
jgi:hypothetical protein